VENATLQQACVSARTRRRALAVRKKAASNSVQGMAHVTPTRVSASAVVSSVVRHVRPYDVQEGIATVMVLVII